jgi:IQ domain-containing protein H
MNPRQKYKGPQGPVLAAIYIQKNYRRFKASSAYAQLKFLMEKATIIQRRYRLYQLKKSTKMRVRELQKESIQVWREMQEEFKHKWGEIKTQKRVEIHINSYSLSELQRLTTEKLKQKENSQIARIFSVKDPNVDVIYICPFTLTNDVYKYYLKILELVEIDAADKRFHIVVPENYVKFPQHYSLA